MSSEALGQPDDRVRVGFLPAEVARDSDVVATLVDLINRAYETAEAGLWRPGVARTTIDEVEEIIARGQLAAAQADGAVVGSVFVRALDAETGWFGALAVAVERAGSGIGGRLVEFAEHHVRSMGARWMQLELLVPAIAHSHTDRLASWYSSLGYRHVEDRDLADLDPDSVAYATVGFRVAVMRKRLTDR